MSDIFKKDPETADFTAFWNMSRFLEEFPVISQNIFFYEKRLITTNFMCHLLTRDHKIYFENLKIEQSLPPRSRQVCCNDKVHKVLRAVCTNNYLFMSLIAPICYCTLGHWMFQNSISSHLMTRDHKIYKRNWKIEQSFPPRSRLVCCNVKVHKVLRAIYA